MALTAWWAPNWYNLDASLKVGARATYGFKRAADSPEPGYDLTFSDASLENWDYRTVTVESIEHATFGSVSEIDARAFGQYTFRFTDGRWVKIEAEQGVGDVNAASDGFPVEACERVWATTSGWALVVTLSDVVEAPRPRWKGFSRHPH